MSTKHTGGYWFEDPRDPRVARWFDGRRPTDHTIRIADLEEGVAPPEPLPLIPVPAPQVGPRREAAPRRAQHLRAPRTPGDAIPEFLWGSERPWWTVLRLRLLVGTCASVLVLTTAIGLHLMSPRGATSDSGRQQLDSQNVGNQSPLDAGALDAAVTQALGSGASGLTADGLQDLLPITCSALDAKTPSQLAGRLSMYRFTSVELATLLRALKVGARDLCDDAARAYRSFFDDVLPMVLIASPGTDAVSVTGDATATGGYVSTGGIVVAGTATATGSQSTGSQASGSAATGSSVTGASSSSCSVPGATSTVSGGTAICSPLSCEGTTTSPRWRPESC
jgi:hypothetical protein